MEKILFLLILNLISLINTINISLLRGEKLFNSNTPIILNIDSPDTSEKKTDVDLICVIDISGSMSGNKIEKVKESLITLISLMDQNDRIGLVLFNSKGIKFLDLTNVTPEGKEIIIEKIRSIRASGGTSILNGLDIAVEMLKIHALEEKISGVILLSYGNDNNLNDKELADGLKMKTKSFNLSFTLHTFGDGRDHDPVILNKLAKIRDGSFYFIDDLKLVKPFSVNVLGVCTSVISINIKIDMKFNFIIKIEYGLDHLFKYILEDKYFETEDLQLISGKEYTYVFEIDLPDGKPYGTEIAEVIFKYNDLKGIEHIQNEKLFLLPLTSGNLNKQAFQKANEEYIRSVSFDSIQQAVYDREKGQKSSAKKN